MNSKLMITLVVLSVALTSWAIECPADYCSKVRCENASAEGCEAKDMIFKEHGSWCGCCNVCLTKLKKGDNCIGTMILGGPVKVACAPGLVCDRSTHTCTEK